MPCKKVGWLVSQLGPSQLCYDVLRSSNEYLAKADDVDISLYWCNDGVRVIQPNFSCMCLYECFGYNGNVIATDLHCASRVLNYPGPNRNKIFYYLYDLCWLRLPQKQWDSLATIYLNPKINLLVRSEDHFNIVKSVWKEPIAIIPSCNIDRIKELL